jgi:hypothetical protein
MVPALSTRTPPILGHGYSVYCEEWKIFEGKITTSAARHAPLLMNLLDFSLLLIGFCLLFWVVSFFCSFFFFGVDVFVGFRLFAYKILHSLVFSVKLF